MVEKIILYSKENCPQCGQSKHLLNKWHLAFEEVAVTAENVEKIRRQFPSIKQLPIIVIDGQVVGGYRELLKWIEQQHKEKLTGVL